MTAIAPSRAEPPLVLAIDVGTSSARASLYDARARRVGTVTKQRTYAPHVTADGGAELDADRLLEVVAYILEDVVRQAGPLTDAVGAVATCTFWHSLLGIDERGRAVTPVYLWLDARSRAAAEALKRRLDERAVHARTGCVLHWSYWPGKLVWLHETHPEQIRAAHRWISFGEYVLQRLAGRAGVSVSMASGTGLLNQHTLEWDEELLAVLPVRREQLGSIESGRTADGLAGGETASEDAPLPGPPAPQLPLSGARVPWLLAVGDGASSNLGAGCATRERLALMVGTSGAMRALWRTERVEIPWGAWCYRADAQRVVMGGAINDGGSLLGWLRSTLQLPPLEEVERDVAALPPDGHGLTVLPLWGGERSPGWAADAHGAIVGLRLHTSPLEIWRAALEGVAITFARLAAILDRTVPEAREVIATGGALLHSPAWLQIMADVLGRPVLASAEPEASSRGAALLALEALGVLPGGIEALAPETDRVYEPVPAHAERFRPAVQRQQELYEALVAR